MGSILILDNRDRRRKWLKKYLSAMGYTVAAISDTDYTDAADFSKFDLVIVNLFPETFRTWNVYMDIKHTYPNLPILVYVKDNHQSLRSLKQVIAAIMDAAPTRGQCVLSRHLSLAGALA